MSPIFYNFYILLLINIVCVLSQNIIQLRNSHVPKDISDSELQRIAQKYDTAHIEEILDNILVPRVVGSANHSKVHNYIVSELESHGLSVEVDEFQARTPNLGTLTFRNIIGTTNPSAERFLVLACHYDSKYYDNIVFVGAIDSAVPCAMMINLAKTLRKELANSTLKDDVALKLIFFDGEEAFENWGPHDSIYGARNLAEVMHKQRSQTRQGFTVTDLHRIDALVLLDLLGAPSPSFYSYFKDTERLYLLMSEAERRLGRKQLLSRYSHKKPYFNRLSSQSYIEDDHIPFLNKGVPIIHMIPTPFPKVWHTAKDDRDIIDMDTVENLNRILRVFVTHYLNLPDMLGARNDDEL